MQPTNRTYSHKETGEKFRLYSHQETHAIALISEQTGCKLNSFLLAAFTPIEFKLMDGKIISLNAGEVLPIPEGNQATHRKFPGQKRFIKY